MSRREDIGPSYYISYGAFIFRVQEHEPRSQGEFKLKVGDMEKSERRKSGTPENSHHSFWHSKVDCVIVLRGYGFSICLCR